MKINTCKSSTLKISPKDLSFWESRLGHMAEKGKLNNPEHIHIKKHQGQNLQLHSTNDTERHFVMFLCCVPWKGNAKLTILTLETLSGC